MEFSPSLASTTGGEDGEDGNDGAGQHGSELARLSSIRTVEHLGKHRQDVALPVNFPRSHGNAELKVCVAQCLWGRSLTLALQLSFGRAGVEKTPTLAMLAGYGCCLLIVSSSVSPSLNHEA